MDLERTTNTADGDINAMKSANCMDTEKSTIHYGRRGHIVLWLGTVIGTMSAARSAPHCPAIEIPSPKTTSRHEVNFEAG